MESSRKKFFAHLLQLAAALSIIGTLFALPAFADDITYLVSVDPSGLSGTNGFMDVQFNPGALPGTQVAFAEMEQPFSWLAGIPDTGTTTGSAFQILFEGIVRFENTTSFNDYFQPLVFGSAPDSFFLDFSGPALESPDGTSTSGTTFAISFFDSNLNPVLTNNPDGFAGLININLDGTTTAETFSDAVTITNESAPAPTPEPGSFLLLGTGLLAAVNLIRREAAQS